MAFTRNWPFFAGVVCYTVAAYISGGVTDLLNVDFPNNGVTATNYAGVWSTAKARFDKPTHYEYTSCDDVQDAYETEENKGETVCPYHTGAYCRGIQSASGISITFVTLLLLHEIWVLGAGGDEAITMNSQYLLRAVSFLMSMIFLLFLISVMAAIKLHDHCTTDGNHWEYGSAFIVLCVFFGLGTVLFFGGAMNRQWGDNSGVWPATSFTPLSQM